jgi:hypothetical protein
VAGQGNHAKHGGWGSPTPGFLSSVILSLSKDEGVPHRPLATPRASIAPPAGKTSRWPAQPMQDSGAPIGKHRRARPLLGEIIACRAHSQPLSSPRRSSRRPLSPKPTGPNMAASPRRGAKTNRPWPTSASPSKAPLRRRRRPDLRQRQFHPHHRLKDRQRQQGQAGVPGELPNHRSRRHLQLHRPPHRLARTQRRLAHALPAELLTSNRPKAKSLQWSDFRREGHKGCARMASGLSLPLPLVGEKARPWT